MFKFIESEELDKKVTEDYINELEKKMKIVFPNILREYYLKHNFSKEKECTFRIEGIDADFILNCIIPLKYGKVSLEKQYEWVLKDDYLSNELIPLAIDMDEDNYYWNSKTGKVYYISLSNVENPILVCNSVDEFFEILNKSVDEVITIPNLNNIRKSNSTNKNIDVKNKIISWIILIFITIVLIYGAIKVNLKNSKMEKEENNIEANPISIETMKQQSQELDDRFNKIFNAN